MPVFPKRRFQHGAVSVSKMREKLPANERVYRQEFMAAYES